MDLQQVNSVLALKDILVRYSKANRVQECLKNYKFVRYQDRDCGPYGKSNACTTYKIARLQNILPIERAISITCVKDPSMTSHQRIPIEAVSNQYCISEDHFLEGSEGQELGHKDADEINPFGISSKEYAAGHQNFDSSEKSITVSLSLKNDTNLLESSELLTGNSGAQTAEIDKIKEENACLRNDLETAKNAINNLQVEKEELRHEMLLLEETLYQQMLRKRSAIGATATASSTA